MYIDAGDYEIFARYWKAKNEKARIIAIHGMAAYHKYFRFFAQHATKHGISVIAPDLTGYGLTGGIPENMNEWAKDLDAVVSEFFDRPLFLMGHSFGAINAVNYLRIYGQSRIKGLIMVSPGISLRTYPITLYKLPGILARVTVSPNSLFDTYTTLDRSVLSTSEAQEVRSDSNCPTIIPYSMLRNFFFLQIKSLLYAPFVRVPALSLIGTSDEIVNWKAEVIFSSLFKQHDIRLFRGYDHRLREFLTLTETNKRNRRTRELLSEMVVSWIFDHLH